jgi:nitrite reductase/ring-hydroxylating ferredoxin subunit
MTSMTVGGYLGGYLAYSRGVGVNNAFTESPPDDWTAVGPDGRRAGDAPVFVHRSSVDGVVRAIGGRCSHAGGPLAEGVVDDGRCTVTCPWHGSVFRMDDGAVVHGPATVPQVAYEVREAGGAVEVRRR